MCSCQNTSPDSPEISALDKQIIHIHACQTPFMSIYLHIQILYTCIDLCMCAYVYLQSFPTKHLKKPRHFPLLKPPFLTWSVWPDGSKGGGLNLCKQNLTPQVLKICQTTKSPISTKKPLSDNLIWVCLSNISMADLQSKSGADALELKTHVDNMCCCFFKSSKQFTYCTCLSSIHIHTLKYTYILVVYGPLIEFSARRCYPSVL